MSSSGSTPKKKLDMDVGKRYLQFILLLLEFLLLGIALWPSCWVVFKYYSWATTPFHWVLIILSGLLVFNYSYLIALLILRILIPVPTEGFFPRRKDGNPNKETIIFMFNMLLVILRHRPPWAAYFSSLLVNIFPLHYFYRRFFGPDTPSTTLGDTYTCLDPYLIKAGKNVQFGAFSAIAAHHFDQRGLYVKKVEIGDNSVIGGYAKIMAGTKIGKNSIVGVDALVFPDTIIGDYEYWSGNPAKKIKDIRPKNGAESVTAEA